MNQAQDYGSLLTGSVDDIISSKVGFWQSIKTEKRSMYSWIEEPWEESQGIHRDFILFF